MFFTYTINLLNLLNGEFFSCNLPLNEKSYKYMFLQMTTLEEEYIEYMINGMSELPIVSNILSTWLPAKLLWLLSLSLDKHKVLSFVQDANFKAFTVQLELSKCLVHSRICYSTLMCTSLFLYYLFPLHYLHQSQTTSGHWPHCITIQAWTISSDSPITYCLLADIYILR